jgi:hypothetical protein
MKVSIDAVTNPKGLCANRTKKRYPVLLVGRIEREKMGRHRQKRLEEVHAQCGRLTVIGFLKGDYLCQCSCDGNINWYRASNVQAGFTKSCGCLRTEYSGTKKFVQLTDRAKRLIRFVYVPRHPVYGQEALAEALGYEAHTVRDYVVRIGKRQSEPVDEKTVHIWQPFRHCGHNRQHCMMKVLGKFERSLPSWSRYFMFRFQEVI